MVVVVPVDADIHEAQDVGEQGRSNRRECGEVRAVRRLQLQDHDRDDDSDHAVAERFEPALPHDEKLTHPKARNEEGIVAFTTSASLRSSGSTLDQSRAPDDGLPPGIAAVARRAARPPGQRCRNAWRRYAAPARPDRYVAPPRASCARDA